MNDIRYSLSDFIKEYTGDYNEEKETYIGLEFENGPHWIRLSREPNDDNRFYVIEMKLKNLNQPVTLDNIEQNVLGVYESIYDMLESTVVNGLQIKTLLFDEKTRILSKD